MDYTIIGGQVNIAKRLQDIAEVDQIVVSHETWAQIKDEVYSVKMKPIMVKGIAYPVQAYQVVGFYDQMSKSDLFTPIGILAEQVKIISPETLVRDIELGRRLDDSFDAIVVAQGDEPIGLVMNYHLTRILNSQSHRAQFFDKPVTEVMDPSPLIVANDSPLENIVEQALARESSKKYDHVIVTEKGRFIGTVPVYNMLEKLSELHGEKISGGSEDSIGETS
jgi:predicted transcriptional regulator